MSGTVLPVVAALLLVFLSVPLTPAKPVAAHGLTFNPTKAKPGEVVTVTATFSMINPVELNWVEFDGTFYPGGDDFATNVSGSGDTLTFKFTVPAGTTAGMKTMSLSAADSEGTSQNSGDFTLEIELPPPPVITLNPVSGPPGTQVTVTGEPFAANGTIDSVTFDGDVVTTNPATPTANASGAATFTFQAPTAAQVTTLGNKTVVVQGSAGDYEKDDATFELTAPTSTVTIEKDAYTINEGDGKVTLTLKRSGSDLSPAGWVKVTTSNGTASAPGDFTALNGQMVNFAANQDTKTVDVTIIDDSDVESTDEAFTVTISDAAIVGIGTQKTATVTLKGPVIEFNETTIAMDENVDTQKAVLTVTRVGDNDGTVTLTYDTADETATGDTDYTAVTGGSVSITGGQAEKTIDITLKDDTDYEGSSNETFTVTLSNPDGGVLGTDITTTVTIKEPPQHPTVYIRGDGSDAVCDGSVDAPVGALTGYNQPCAVAGVLQALENIDTDGEIKIGPGVYAKPVSVKKKGVKLRRYTPVAAFLKGLSTPSRPVIGSDTLMVPAISIEADDVLVEGFEIKASPDSTQAVIALGSSAGTVVVTGVTILDNVVIGGQQGIVVATGSHHNTLDGNDISGADIGVELSGAVENKVINNKIHQVAEDGIVLEPVTVGDSTVTPNANTLSANQISMVGEHGIHVGRSTGNTITQNVIHDAGLHGIVLLVEADDTTITDNEIYGTPGDGIRLEESDDNDITGNVIHDVGGAAIHLTDSTDDAENGSDGNDIVDNILSTSWYGVRINWGEDNDIYGNSFRNNTQNVVDDGEDNDYTDQPPVGFLKGAQGTEAQPRLTTMGTTSDRGNYYTDYRRAVHFPLDSDPLVDENSDSCADTYYPIRNSKGEEVTEDTCPLLAPAATEPPAMLSISIASGNFQFTGLTMRLPFPFAVLLVNPYGAVIPDWAVDWNIAQTPPDAVGTTLDGNRSWSWVDGAASMVANVGTTPGTYLIDAHADLNNDGDTTDANEGTQFSFTATPVFIQFQPAPAHVPLSADGFEYPVDVKLVVRALTPVDGIDVSFTFNPAVIQMLDTNGSPDDGVQAIIGNPLNFVITHQIDNTLGTVRLALGRQIGGPAAFGVTELATFRVKGIFAPGGTDLFLTNIEASFEGQPMSISGIHGLVFVTPYRLAFKAEPVRGAAGMLLGVQPAVEVLTPDFINRTVRTDDNTTEITLKTFRWVVMSTNPLVLLDLPADDALVCDQTVDGVTKMKVVNGLAAFSGCRLPEIGSYYLNAVTADTLAVPTYSSVSFAMSLPGDTNGDCRVSILDFSKVVTHFGKTSIHPDWTDLAKLAFPADLNGDQRVSIVDFSTVVSRFNQMGTGCWLPTNGIPFPTVPLTVAPLAP